MCPNSSRGCGDFEDAEGVRTDAPTSDVETHALVAVFAACHGVPLFSSDIKNAYFQAMPIDRIVTMRQPQGGLPGVALNGVDLKLRYKNGPFNFQELGVLTASDASFAGEPNSRSQQGRIHFLVPAPATPRSRVL